MHLIPFRQLNPMGAAVLLMVYAAHGQYITLSANDNKPSSETVVIASNEVATVVHLSTSSYPYGFLEVVCGAVTNNYSVDRIIGGTDNGGPFRHANLPVIAGPATFRVHAHSDTTSGLIALCTLCISKPGSTYTPVNTVVIPNDSNGPVRILLESSPDLIKWVEASPGTYGTTSSNRFFRVRSER